ncbi:hypothetical protein EN866_32975 [Mesorhizobium sp. M2D.F.Ca.ET.223.01.1.1]|uniref:hypothetical protein n=1 Tax=Mesorhizobium sp. M2D.F.Ca.ET.223.01.1.1 TaxID=2563940 RepID=UPI001093106C|nr:hypothetical protein [Mesorhizobium sp. M2D.F.Ca.ET.223.01.1.1]TGR84622.1 hypothetical protein EN866_32975 [Mesorhizobium sp. M2D.F.Ca.ET.223.01.1.1]TGT64493.1 hypothetical protein EN802_32410 [bacterium M00.F.Ca.ET.159.01.1.1]TGT79338.1 hypothetical protein EN800_31750 [bacterium M00.F.Ca.ET.157.01.1.1]
MPASDLPVEGTAEDSTLSFNDGVDAIDNLLDDSGDPKPAKKVEAKDQAEQPDESEQDEPADEANAAEDAEDLDGSEPLKGGRFAPDSAKVTLDDGSVITIAELKRNNLFQRDYTRKTTELKTERDAFAQQKSQLDQHAQSLAQQRDFILSAAQKFIPQPPSRELLQSDPLSYMQAKADYDERMQVFNQLAYQQQANSRLTEEQQSEATNQLRQEESKRLLEAIPEFKDRNVYQNFWNDAVETMASKYGFTKTEIEETLDHRFYVAMRDLVKFHKALNKVPQVKQEVEKKPQMISGSRRMDPKAKTSREAQQRAENLRKSGSFDAGVAALMDLNL